MTNKTVLSTFKYVQLLKIITRKTQEGIKIASKLKSLL